MQLLDTANRALRQLMVVGGVTSQTVEVGGHAVHYYRRQGEGTGPPVLLVHGLGSSANAFYRIIRPLSKRFSSLYAIDLPGNGFSPDPKERALTLYEHVDVIEAFQAKVIKQPAFLVGNSLGGAMAAYLAGKTPKEVVALGLICPAGAKVKPERLAELISAFDVKTSAQARAMAKRLYHRAPLGMMLFGSVLKDLYATPTVRSIVTNAKPDDGLPEEMLQSLAMPTLLLWGQSEKLLPYEGIEYFRANLPKHALIHEVPGFGHVPQMESPREVVRHLTQFADASGL